MKLRLANATASEMNGWHKSTFARSESSILASGSQAFSWVELGIAETSGQVVVHHAYGLHEGVANRGADEGEPAFLQVFAHGV